MHRNAVANDLRYLHRSLEKQRHSAQRTLSKKAPIPEAANHEAAPRIRSYKDHLDSIDGQPLDHIQASIRKDWALNSSCISKNKKATAVLLKTQHDLHFWETLQILGISASFHQHRSALEKDQQLLKDHLPKSDARALQEALDQVTLRLQRALGSVH